LEILELAGMIELDAAWTVVFPQQRAATEIQQADIDNKKADTLSKIMSAASTPGGEAVVLNSALEVLNLGDIDTEEIDLDDDVDPEIDPEPEPDDE
ncbi:MAG: hypothetical protein KAT62_13950, partial [Desulfuromonadales bacterium]|nr:hypothetical protein [Desulfuromonadales bacterium]